VYSLTDMSLAHQMSTTLAALMQWYIMAISPASTPSHNVLILVPHLCQPASTPLLSSYVSYVLKPLSHLAQPYSAMGCDQLCLVHLCQTFIDLQRAGLAQATCRPSSTAPPPQSIHLRLCACPFPHTLHLLPLCNTYATPSSTCSMLDWQKLPAGHQVRPRRRWLPDGLHWKRC
jgi:hypothetical protein